MRTAPPGLARTRDALHSVAEQVLAPLRVQATGHEIALMARDGGVATPDLPGGGWVGFVGSDLVVVADDGAVARTPLATLREAGRAAGLHSFLELPDESLGIEDDHARFLGEVYEFADAALEQLRAEAAESTDPSPIRLWPEHFDIAYEKRDEATGRRAGYGVSPGDEEHPEPYAYVTPWAGPSGDAVLWNATGFAGAELGWAEIAAADDPAALVLDFWRARRDALG